MAVADLKRTKTEFDRDGVAVVRGLMGEFEIQTLQKEAEYLWQTQPERKPQNLRIAIRRNSEGEWALDRLDPVADISTVFQQVNDDARLLLLGRTLLDDDVLVLKEKIIYKRPGVEGFGFHRDEPYFGISGVPGADMITIGIALDASNEENGATEFYPELRLSQLQSAASEPRDISRLELEQQSSVKPFLRPGDAVMFDGLVPHRSAMNHSSNPRCAYFVTYAPVRYSGCRERYYHLRELEQATERAKEFSGPFFIIDVNDQRRIVRD